MAAVKLDENVPDSVRTILSTAGHDVALAREEGLAGVPDADLLAAATAEDRVLVSLDRGLANVIQHPPANTAGIVVIRLRDQTLARVRLAAVRLAALLSSAPVEKRLWVLDESHLRIWPRSPG